jgi:hypothetical protein
MRAMKPTRRHPRPRRQQAHPAQEHPPFCGRPIIAWSIGAALDSGCFDR